MEKHLWGQVPNSELLFESIISNFRSTLHQLTIDAISPMIMQQQGNQLWQRAVHHAQHSDNPDDRLLYWSRLVMLRDLRQWLVQQSAESHHPSAESRLVAAFEQASRGLLDQARISGPGQKRILISGFDPFGLQASLQKSNTSGASVLALHQTQLELENQSATVVGAIFPVRYDAFDQGWVEQFFQPFLAGSQKPDLVVTLSQNQAGFKIEHYAGRRRSTENFTDNDGCVSGATRRSPLVPPGLAAGPEFIETRLPAAAMRSALGRSNALASEIRFMQLATDHSEPEWRFNSPTAEAVAVCGSGGGFLSNEIFYRTNLLRLNSDKPNIPMGHFHIPAMSDDNHTGERQHIVATVRKALLAAMNYL